MAASADFGRYPVTETDITCTLCSQPFSTPKLVDCLHTYCHQCIKDNLIRQNENFIFKCPQCKHDTPLNDRSAQTLITNHQAIGLQEIFTHHSTKVMSCVICSLKGDNSDATHRCLDCDDILCVNCSKGHNSSTATTSHRVVCLEDLSQGKHDQKILRKRRIFCGYHKNEACRIFCHTCSVPTCVHCVLSSHKDHVYDTIEEAARQKRMALSETLKSFSTTTHSLDLQPADADLEQLNQDETKFMQDVTENTDLIIDKIKQQSQYILEMGRQSFADERKRRESRKEVAVYELPRRENILKVCQRIAETDGLELVVMESAIQKGLKLLSKHDHLKQSPLITFQATFNMPLEKDFISFHRIIIPGLTEHADNPESSRTSTTSDSSFKDEENTSPEDPLLKQKEDVEDKVDENFKPQFVRPTTAVFQSLKYKRNFSTKVSTDITEPDIIDMAFSTGFGTVLLVDKNNTKLKVYKPSGDMAFLVDMKGKCNPFTQFVNVTNGNICAVYENNLLVLSKHLKLDHTVNLTPKDGIKEQPIISNFGEDIIVGNLPDSEMRVLSSSGKTKRSWKRPVNSNAKMVSMNFAGEDKVITTTWSKNGSVNIESEKRGLLLKINGDKRTGLKWQPADAVVNPRGHVIVTDSRRNEICVFSATGDNLCLVNTAEYNVLQPNCVIVDKNGKMYVSYAGGLVAVFEFKYT